MGIRDDDHEAVRGWLARAERGEIKAETPRRRRSSALPFIGGGRSYGGLPMFWGGNGCGDSDFFPGGTLPGAKADYRSRAGALHKNAVVAACLGWIVDTFGQARLIVVEEDEEDGEHEPQKGHALPKMLKRPNDFYSANALWSATVIARKLYGQAYWFKIRNGSGSVIGVRWIPNQFVKPLVPNGSVTDVYIAAYEYKLPGNEPIQISAEDVVHFRDGLSPDNERLGWDRMEAVLRDIVTTNNAATFTAALMTNMGIAAVVFTGTDGVPLDDEEADAIEQGWRDSTSGENVGAPFALKHPVNVERVGLSPEELALDILPKRSVAQICSVMRLSPLVLGLEDDRGTYENVGQATKAAWESCLIPLQKSMADDLTHQLLIPDFGGTDTQCVAWDRKHVEALQEGKDAAAARVSMLVGGKQVIEVNEARAEMGLPEIEGGDDLTTDKVDPVEEQIRLKEAEMGLEDGAAAYDDEEFDDESEDEYSSPFPGSRNGSAKSLDLSLSPLDGFGFDFVPEWLPDVKAADDVVASLGLEWDEFADLEDEDLDELLSPAEVKALGLLRGEDSIKASVAARRERRRRKSHEEGHGNRPGGRFDPDKHPRGPGGKFAPKPGGGDSSRHERLARAAERASRRHERLRRKGITGDRYDRAVERAIRLKRATHRARQGRAKELYRLRKGSGARQGRLPLKPGAKTPRRAVGRNTPERQRTAQRLRDARNRSRTESTASTHAADHPPGYIGEVKTNQIRFDPERFQYKLAQTDTHTGAVGSLAGVKKWDAELAGVVSVWKDPKNGIVYVVNGHNRLDLANKLGVEKIAVRYLDAPDAQWARAKGALANIAEGRGTSTDAAKFFRDSGIKSRADLQDRGIPLTEGKTNEGLALAGLSSPLFRRTIDGSLPVEKGAIIGGGGLSDSQQSQLAKLFDKQKGNVTGNQLREWVDEAKASGTRSKDSGASLFGKDDGPDEESLFLHRTALNAHVKERLSREKKLFGTVSRRGSAETLSRAGNVIDAESSGKVSRDASEALNVFDTLKRTSVFSGAANDYSSRMATAKGPGERKRIQDDYYEEVKRRVRTAYDLGR